MTPAERIMARIPNRRQRNGCWLWPGKTAGGGYGMIKVSGRHRYCHVLVFVHHYGEVPAGLEVDHTCGVKNCVNPRHLEAVTHAVNVQRGMDRWRDRRVTRLLYNVRYNDKETSCPTHLPSVARPASPLHR